MTPAEKAQEILAKRRDYKLCLQAGICPHCAKSLISPKKKRVKWLCFSWWWDGQTGEECPFYYQECEYCNERFEIWIW